MYIEIEVSGKGQAVAELDDRNLRIAEEIYMNLPFESRANLWGEEVYFEIPLETDDENPSPKAEKGDVSYWSPGPALCIFFGQTQPYSPVNHLGRVVEGLDMFKYIKSKDKIVLSRK